MTHTEFAMLRCKPPRFAPSLACAATVLVLSSVRAHAAELEPITVSAHIVPAPGALAISGGRRRGALLNPVAICAPRLISAPVVRTVGHGSATNASIQTVTIMARVKYNPVILTTHSGVALLDDDVADAARTACDSIDPLNGDGPCVRRAIESARPQVTAAVTRARSAGAG